MIEVIFQGEQAIDAGGVLREWYSTLSRQICNPGYALFIPPTPSYELIPGGPTINITEENKQEYIVQLIVRHSLVTSVEKQLDQLAKGFEEIIPQKFLKLLMMRKSWSC